MRLAVESEVLGSCEVGFSAWVPIPKGRQGGIVPPPSVLAPESALGSVPTVALSSAPVVVIVGRCVAQITLAASQNVGGSEIVAR